MWKKSYVGNVTKEILGEKITKYTLFNQDTDLLVTTNQNLKLKYDNKPKYLYKYVSFNLPQDEEKLFNLFSGKILLTKLSDFNDTSEGENLLLDVFKISDKQSVQQIFKILGINWGEESNPNPIFTNKLTSALEALFGVKYDNIKSCGYIDFKITNKINESLKNFERYWSDISNLSQQGGVKDDFFSMFAPSACDKALYSRFC